MVPPPKKQKPEDPMVIAERNAREQHEFMNLHYPRRPDAGVITDMQLSNHGFPWVAKTLDTWNNYGELCISIRIANHMSHKADCWFCEAELTMLINHTTNDNKNQLVERTVRFGPRNEVFEFSNVVVKEEFLDDAGYFPTDNVCHILIQVKVLTISGDKFLKRLVMDWSDEMSGSDICFIVEGKRFYLGKHALARHTTHFESMFFGSFKEAKMDTIELKDLCKVKFEKFLNYIHRFNGTAMNLSDIWDLAEIAHRFNSQSVMLDCESYMMYCKDMEPYEKVIMGDVYQFYALLEDNLNQLTSVSQILSLTRSEYYAELSPDTKKIVQQKQEILMREQDLLIAQQQQQMMNNQNNFIMNNQYAGPSTSNYRPPPPRYPQVPFAGNQAYGMQPTNNFGAPQPNPNPAFNGNPPTMFPRPTAQMGPPPLPQAAPQQQQQVPYVPPPQMQQQPSQYNPFIPPNLVLNNPAPVRAKVKRGRPSKVAQAAAALLHGMPGTSSSSS